MTFERAPDVFWRVCGGRPTNRRTSKALKYKLCGGSAAVSRAAVAAALGDAAEFLAAAVLRRCAARIPPYPPIALAGAMGAPQGFSGQSGFNATRGIGGLFPIPHLPPGTANTGTRTVQAREKNSRAIKTLAITSKTGRLRRKAPPHAIERQTEEWRQASGSWPEAIEAPGHASTRAGLGSCTRTGIGRQVRSRRCPAANRRRPEGPGQRARRRGQGAPNWPPEACRRRRDQ